MKMFQRPKRASSISTQIIKDLFIQKMFQRPKRASSISTWSVELTTGELYERCFNALNGLLPFLQRR